MLKNKLSNLYHQFYALLNWSIEDISDKYRKTKFGIIWIAISFASFVMVKTVVFSNIVIVENIEYTAYIIIGFVCWIYFASVMTDGVSLYLHHRKWILSTNLQIYKYIIQSFMKICIEHVVILISSIVIIFILDVNIEINPILIVTAYILLILNSVSVIIILAPVVTYRRDVLHFISSFVRLLFFATPIIWYPIEGSQLEGIAAYNPITHYINIIRNPLINEEIPYASFIVVTTITFVIVPLAIYVYRVTKDRIVFWL